MICGKEMAKSELKRLIMVDPITAMITKQLNHTICDKCYKKFIKGAE
jgi:hypothetical protein